MSRSFRTLAVLLLVSSVAAAVPHRPGTPATYALVIGISDYLHYGDEPGGDLPGAANDATAFRDVLVGRMGVPESNIRVLLDLEATRARIQREMSQWLPSVVRPGDLVWIFYAGHGSQAWDVAGDEDDGLDETICPTDVARTGASTDIRDDELSRWLSALPAVEVILIWDKCHAESSMRAATPFGRSRVLGRDVRDLPRPTGMRLPREARALRGLGSRVEAEPLRVTEEWHRDRSRARDAARPVLIEIAASQADQVAMDAAWPAEGGGPPVFGGAFTTNFTRNIWQAPGEATLEEVFRRTANDMRAQRFEQRPMLTDEAGMRTRSLEALAAVSAPSEAARPGEPAGAAALPTTGVTAAAGELPIVAAAGERVTLGAGVAAGVTVGSVYEAAGALLRVVDVTATEATAVRAERDLLPGAPPTPARTPAAGATARLVAHVFPVSDLRVSISDLETAEQEALVRVLGGWPSLTLVRTAGDYAHLIVRRTDDGYVLLGVDGFPRHRIRARSASDAVREMTSILTAEARAQQLARLDNPAQPFELDFRIDDDDNDLIVGDFVRIHIRSERSGYLTLIDLPADGTVTVVFPTEPGQDNRVAAGEPFVLPRLSDPAILVTPPLGRSMVRAFVTERPLDIRLQPRDPQLGVHVLDALRAAAGESPLRGSQAMPVGNWASASIVYDVME